MKKTYTLRDILDYKGIRIPIKENYTEREFLLIKSNLSSPSQDMWGTGSGACMIYDPIPAKARAWVNRQIRNKNVALVQAHPRSRAKVVRLDESKPLPKDYYTFTENLIENLPSHLME